MRPPERAGQQRDLDSPTGGNQPAYNQQRPGLAIDGGRVYATFGGLSGDCGAYQGSVVSAPLSGNGPLTSWRTPTTREGAIWAPGGPVVGPNGDLWISIGNGASESGAAYDGSDSVTELSLALQRLAYFAPSTWAADNAGDLDLGSTQPVLAADNSVFIVGKRGTGYLLSAAVPGGIGGQLAEQDICEAYGTAAVTGSTVYEPCRADGMAAVEVKRGEQDDRGAVARPGRTATDRRSSAAGPSGSPPIPTTAARCTSSARPPARSSTRSRSARACRTSRRCP